jgi:hypothetical protein
MEASFGGLRGHVTEAAEPEPGSSRPARPSRPPHQPSGGEKCGRPRRWSAGTWKRWCPGSAGPWAAMAKHKRPVAAHPPLSLVAIRDERVVLSALLWNGRPAESVRMCPAAAYALGRDLIDCAEQLQADLALVDTADRRLSRDAGDGPVPDGDPASRRTAAAAPAGTAGLCLTAFPPANVPGYPRPRRVRPGARVESRR